MYFVPLALVLLVLSILANWQRHRSLRVVSDIVIGLPIFYILAIALLSSSTNAYVIRLYQAQMLSDGAAQNRVCMRLEVDPARAFCWISSDLKKELGTDASKQVTAKVRLQYDVGQWNPQTVFAIKYMEFLAVDGKTVSDNSSRGPEALEARQENFGEAPAIKWWFW